MGHAATPERFHILIIGAGLTGLILAQTLRKYQQSQRSPQVTFEIFERDAHAFHRGGGWGLTIHWALTDLAQILPEEIMSRFDDCLVNPDAVEQGITGNFLFFNVRTGETVVQWPVPKGVASRVSREDLMRLLMTGLDIQWGKTLTDLEFAEDRTTDVSARFADASEARGNLVVGCDGSRSAVRRCLCPHTYQNDRLPVRLIGLRLDYPIEKIRKCLAIDPHVFQGGDPETNVYFWFSFIRMPREVDSAETAACQIMISWPYVDERSEMPVSNEERLSLLRTLSKSWAEPFKELIQDIPEKAELRELVLEDWPPIAGRWDNRDGRVTLVGDAAHCMTMFRGEAANHGIIDVRQLAKGILPEMSSVLPESHHSVDMKAAIEAYEQEMIERTFPAARNSRQACLDANNFEAITKLSPLATERKRPEVKE